MALNNKLNSVVCTSLLVSEKIADLNIIKTTPMTNDVEKRVASLEKSIRIYQFLTLGIVLTTLVFLISSFNDQQVPDKIKAKAFEVVDQSGKVLVTLSEFNEGGAITTFNKSGNYLVDIISNKTGFGNVNLYDGKGKPTMQLFNVKDGGGAIVVKNKEGKDALYLGLMSSGSGHISLNNSKGIPLMLLGENVENAADLRMFNASGKYVARLSTVASHGTFELCNNVGEIRVMMVTEASGLGVLVVYDREGKLLGSIPVMKKD